MSDWTVDDLPDLTGHVAVVTGASGGLGAHIAGELARHGAHVVLAARDTDAARRIADSWGPDSSTSVVALDLAALSSVRAFAGTVARHHRAVDLLVNNAGVMGTPRRRTADGFELQIGTNHLGHFALTGLLMPTLLAGPHPRVVTVSSLMHRRVDRVPASFRGARPYRKWRAYSESKLANLLFTMELGRRAVSAGSPLVSLAAHPGFAATRLQTSGPELAGPSLGSVALRLVTRLVAQSAEAGAWPILYAAAEPLPTNAFVGPGFAGWRGAPQITTASPAAYDADASRELWDRSETATGVRYPF
jgi:NAD(P)-dependent dehydrogenase (short-subunit alcohol dehydrogenase family)